MTTFFIANVSVKNPEKFQEYAQKSGATFAAYGGAPLARGKVAGNLVGSSEHQAAAVIKFPDLDSLNNWFNSPEYQALVPLRDQAADMIITNYQIPA